jgi:GAF domain-containing protein
MSQLFKAIRALLRVRFPYTDLGDQQRARDLIRLTWAIIGFGFVTALAFLQVDQGPVSIVLLVTAYAILLSMAIIPVLINRGHLLIGSLAFVIYLFVMCVFAYITTPLGATLTLFTLPIIAAGVLLNRRSMVVMLGLVITAIIFSALLNSLGILRPSRMMDDSNPFGSLVLAFAGLSADAIMLVVFAGGQRVMLRQNFALTEDMRTSSGISQVLSGVVSQDKIMEQTIDLIRDQLNYYHVQIFLVEDKTKLLVQQAGTTISRSHTDTARRRIAPDDPSVFNEVLRTGKVIRISSETSTSRRKELLPSMQSELLLPLRRLDDVLGVLDVQSLDTDDFTKKDSEVLETIAAQLSLAIQNAQFYAALQSVEQERQQLSVRVQEASQQIDLLNRQASGAIWTHYLESNAGVIGFDWQHGSVTPNTALTPTLERTFKNALPEVYTDQDGAQILSVPIVSRGQVLGAMEFRTANNRAWSNRSIELARIVSQRLALALDNIRLFEQAQIIASREQMANQIAARMQAKTDVDAVLAVAAETFQQALGATRASIRLGTPDMSQVKTEIKLP